MSYFLLPEINNNLQDINILYNIKNNLSISITLNSYLNNVKKQIDENSDNWDFIKKYTNPYEFIHTIIPGNKTSVSKLKPLSRSFYKMIEISNILNIFDNYKDCNINTFHLAEGPGGFIEATTYMRNNENDTYKGMTLINEDPNVPGWKKSEYFLNKHKNVSIEYGATGTGDLLKIENLKFCYEKYHNSMDIITADGGFDFSVDFNQQEILATKLLFAQVSFALMMQKKEGHFILKIFDIFSKTTLDILYLLSSVYKQVYIVKPNTSRLANSEKYIVCKHFKGVSESLSLSIINQYPKLESIEYISSLFDFQLDLFFINKIEEYNAIFGQQQIENISSTLNMIHCKNKNEKLETFKKNNINKCIQWCEKNNISHNKSATSTNIFMN
jgi:23S rRNA U2552 (ribose-2'-O)-methylase RlmE/FtsJ